VGGYKQRSLKWDRCNKGNKNSRKIKYLAASTENCRNGQYNF